MSASEKASGANPGPTDVGTTEKDLETSLAGAGVALVPEEARPFDPADRDRAEEEGAEREKEPPVGRLSPEQREKGEGRRRSPMEQRIMRLVEQGREDGAPEEQPVMLLRRRIPRLVALPPLRLSKALRGLIAGEVSKLPPAPKSQRLKDVIFRIARMLVDNTEGLTLEEGYVLAHGQVADVVGDNPLFEDKFLKNGRSSAAGRASTEAPCPTRPGCCASSRRTPRSPP